MSRARHTDPLGLRADIDRYYAAKPTVADIKDTRNPHLPTDRSPASAINSHSHALHFSVVQQCSTSRARASVLSLPHGTVEAPVFMPVGTQASIKGLTSAQVSGINTEIMLGNTYHLGLRPGPDTVSAMGGLHRFMDWPNNLLTDSGGFQMVSLVELAKITETGVEFNSPFDGTPTLLTPELSIKIQNLLGADIIMALDDVCSSVDSTSDRFIEACHRTIRWLDRCIEAHTRPHHQALYGIVQGGLDTALRDQCLDDMLKRDAWLPGYAIGGLAGGESKDAFWQVIAHCCQRLPASKPRYAMGVGYPLDLIVCVALGVDQFDCVWPCRTARFGSAIVDSGLINLRRAEYQYDDRPVDSECQCEACKNYTRSMLASMIAKTPLGCHLLTLHNLTYIKSLMTRARQSISDQRFPAFVRDFMQKLFPQSSNAVPTWALEALRSVSIELGEWGDRQWTAPIKQPLSVSAQTGASGETPSKKRKMSSVPAS